MRAGRRLSSDTAKLACSGQPGNHRRPTCPPSLTRDGCHLQAARAQPGQSAPGPDLDEPAILHTPSTSCACSASASRPPDIHPGRPPRTLAPAAAPTEGSRATVHQISMPVAEEPVQRTAACYLDDHAARGSGRDLRRTPPSPLIDVTLRREDARGLPGPIRSVMTDSRNSESITLFTAMIGH